MRFAAAPCAAGDGETRRYKQCVIAGLFVSVDLTVSRVAGQSLDAGAAALGQPAYVTSTVQEITRTPARPFADWAKDNAAALSARTAEAALGRLRSMSPFPPHPSSSSTRSATRAQRERQ